MNRILARTAIIAAAVWISTLIAADTAILRERVDRLLPSAMEAHSIDLWIVFTRE